MPPEISTDELNRILSMARIADGDVGPVPARHWWPALLLTLLDTALPVRELLAVGRQSYDAGNLSVGLFVYSLHPEAAAAVNRIVDQQTESSPLFAWPVQAVDVIPSLVPRSGKVSS